MKSSIDVCIIIVSFNTKELLRLCLTSVFASTLGDYKVETIVVDNGSEDGSPQMVSHDFPHVTLIQNTENLGFSAANNLGIRKSEGRYILLLNSDTEVQKKTLSVMISFMDSHPEFGAGTCKLELPDRRIDPACHRGFPTPWAAFTYFSGLEKIFPHSALFSQYHLGFEDFTKVHPIDCPSGAFFLVRKEVVSDVGLLDEEYFMYGEDIDWAYRMKEEGYTIGFNPDVITLHRKKQSGRNQRDAAVRKKTVTAFYETMGLFYRKHYGHKYPIIVMYGVLAFLRLNIFIRSLFI
jgi:GT2 family glycosyltransferase